MSVWPLRSLCSLREDDFSRGGRGQVSAKRNVDIYVTGSNSKMLSKDVATNFRGRKTEIQLMPLSFSEFHRFRDGENLNGRLEKFVIK